MNLVGTVGEAKGTRSSIHSLQRDFARNAKGAVDLNRPIHHSVHGGGNGDLDRRNIRSGVQSLLHDLRTSDRHQPGRMNVDIGIGDEALDELFGFEGPPCTSLSIERLIVMSKARHIWPTQFIQ